MRLALSNRLGSFDNERDSSLRNSQAIPSRHSGLWMAKYTSYRVHIIVGCQTSPPSVALSESARLVHELSKERRTDIFKSVLQRLGYGKVFVHRVSLGDYKLALDGIEGLGGAGDVEPVIVCNFVDGTEADGYPGISVTRDIERRRLPFTGGDSRFCQLASSKTEQKEIFQKNNVPTCNFQVITPLELSTDMETAITAIGFPLIVKPIISYACLGISPDSVVHDKSAACSQVRALFHSSHLSKVNQDGGVYVERFLSGPEYVALVTGDEKLGIKCYPVVRRVFNGTAEQNLLSFDEYWEDVQDGEGKGVTMDGFVNYTAVEDEALQERLQMLAKSAYSVLGGNGYAKVDLRADDENNTNVYVLEVNVNTILSLGSKRSVGQILTMANIDAEVLVEDILSYAVARHANQSSKDAAAQPESGGGESRDKTSTSAGPCASEIK